MRASCSPRVRFARWLWQRIDVLTVDRAVVGIATVSVHFAQWLWRVFELRVIGRDSRWERNIFGSSCAVAVAGDRRSSHRPDGRW